MIKISKPGSGTLTVTASAYENFYKTAGWHTNEPIREQEPVEEPAEDEWADVLESEEAEKPLSEMNVQELREKAAAMGIDLAGATSARDIRAKIKRHM